MVEREKMRVIAGSEVGKEFERRCVGAIEVGPKSCGSLTVEVCGS